MGELPPLHDYQRAAVDRISELRTSKRGTAGLPILGVAPPGAGKSRIMLDLAEGEKCTGGRAMIKVHRTMLLEQLIRVADDAGIRASVIAPGYQYDDSCDLVLASTQTLYSRVVQRGTVSMPDVSLVINDEAHQQASRTERAIAIGAYTGSMVHHGYLTRGCDMVGMTATPLMGQRLYQELVPIAHYSQLRKRGMHQPVVVYGPDEIDTKGLKANVNGDFAERALEKRVSVIFGSVYNEWKALNPDALPAILFAPSVGSSVWFAEQYVQRGVPAAHIDGEKILMPGATGNLEAWPATPENRDELLRRSRTGEVKVVMHRFVLREAIDMPWLYHGIFATVMGSPTTALQSVGRLQRAFPDYTHKILQDHGGFYWRHGSPNSDRVWRLGQTNKSYSEERVQRLLKGEQPEGIRCGKCGAWRLAGPVCINEHCRHASTVSTRVVRQLNGRLKKTTGPVFVAASNDERANKLWTSTLFSCAGKGLPISSAVARYRDSARRMGLTTSVDSMRVRPPDQSSTDWHRACGEVFPWLKKRRAAKK